MEKQKMTIHRALSELKLMDSKIEKQILEIKPCGIFQKEKMINAHVKPEDFQKKAQSNFDSINTLITRKNLIKTAIVQSNSKTIVNIANKEMTVAEAINFKAIIKYKRDFIDSLKSELQKAIGKMNKKNEEAEAKLQQILEATFGKENVKVGKDDVDMVRKPFMESNEYYLFDPLKIEEKIETMENEVDEFEAEVDAILSESNAVTIIEI